MKVEELRIKNKLDVDGNFWEVSQLSKDELYFKENEEYNHILNAKPIPLTEDILFKCPEIVKGKQGWYNYDYYTNCELLSEKMCISYNIISKRFAIFDTIDNDTIDIISYPIYSAKEVEYLHDFQNKIFALTNQELNIEL